ncbi:MAG: oxidoreductase [Gammaproteobacteria bacterium RBG_16_57_12]|nr:MAG: oxidoreductase [Gammaproteobacteria bacterium RBG_16_57_12]
MKSILSGIILIALYLLLVLAPLGVLLIEPVPAGSGFWWDLSLAMGFAGMGMLGVQFLLTARFRRASAPFGIDIIYFFHRYLAVFAFGLIVLHCLIIRVDNPSAIGTLNPLEADGYMAMGLLAMALFTLVIASSLWRKPLRIPYDGWRQAHTLFTAVGFVLAIGHIKGVGYYIDTPLKQSLWTAFTAFWVLLILYVRLVKPLRMLRAPYRVMNVVKERGDTWTLTVAADHHSGLRFEPGQFAWLTLRASPYALREHPFSISSSAVGADPLEFTIKELGDFTRTIKDARPGELVYLDGPYGAFSIDRVEASSCVFIAGGVGIAPIMSMLRTLADRGDRRPLLLIYANNHWEKVIFREELEELKTRLSLRVVHVLFKPHAGWQGESGLVTADLLSRVLPGNRRELEYFVCGPKPMNKAVEHALESLHIPLRQVRTELFDLV